MLKMLPVAPSTEHVSNAKSTEVDLPLWKRFLSCFVFCAIPFFIELTLFFWDPTDTIIIFLCL